jgi:hypothetical protein
MSGASGASGSSGESNESGTSGACMRRAVHARVRVRLCMCMHACTGGARAGVPGLAAQM